MSFKSLKSARTLTRHIGSAALVAAVICAAARAETPDYFVEYAEPAANLYVDTGIIGKSGTRVQIRAANFGGGEILIGARHTDSVRFEPVRFWGEQSGMKYANNSYHQTVFSPYYGDWIYDHAVSSAGVLTATVTDCGAGHLRVALPVGHRGQAGGSKPAARLLLQDLAGRRKRRVDAGT